MLFRRNEHRWKPATLRLYCAGIKFYFQTVLDRRWRLFSIPHAEDQQTLLVLLTQHKVIRILSCVKTFHNYVFFSLVYACGLHLGEALALTVDAQAVLLFPALGKGGKSGRAVTTTMNRASVQRAFLRARTAAAVTRALVSTPHPSPQLCEAPPCSRADDRSVPQAVHLAPGGEETSVPGLRAKPPVLEELRVQHRQLRAPHRYEEQGESCRVHRPTSTVVEEDSLRVVKMEAAVPHEVLRLLQGKPARFPGLGLPRRTHAAYPTPLSAADQAIRALLFTHEGTPDPDESNPLVCPKCGCEMRAMELIQGSMEIRDIFAHLFSTGCALPGFDPNLLN